MEVKNSLNAQYCYTHSISTSVFRSVSSTFARRDNIKSREMDQEKSQSQSQTISLANLEAAASLRRHTEDSMDQREVADILQAAASHFSKTAPSSSENDLIQKSNDEAVLQKLEGVLKTHFHPLNLNTLPSVIVYLLLNYFLLRRENKEVEAAKKLYEDHIALLKDKNSELEERVRDEASSSACKCCEELRSGKESLSAQYAKLKQSYDEVRLDASTALAADLRLEWVLEALCAALEAVANIRSALKTPESSFLGFALRQVSVWSCSASSICESCYIKSPSP